MPGYRNHIYRVFTFANHFLEGKLNSKFKKVVEIGLVYHDIALWTDKKLAYLEPSAERAQQVCKNRMNDDELSLLYDIIYWHHKITPFEGKHEDIVNAVRKADWIDATLGVVSYGMPFNHINKVKSQLPNNGFHATLAGFGPRLRGWNIYRIVTELGSIFKL